MENIGLVIDGRPVVCPKDASILEAATANGITIPTLCHHPSLQSVGACRLCLVEDEKSGRLMASCVSPAAAGLSILTDSPRLRTHRINIIRLMIAEHPESCLVCNKGNRCQLRRLAAALGISQTGLYPMAHNKRIEQSNPFLIRDLNKCILCGKCIRADHELVMVGAIDYNRRGFNSRPFTAYDLPLEHSDCTFCGTCVSLCPTGALSVKNKVFAGTPQREALTVCGFCGVGCSLVLGVVDDRIIETNPAHAETSVNGSTLCVRGHFAHDFLNSRERLTHPVLRTNGEFVPVSWDKAFELVANRLQTISKVYGPQSIAFLGSSKCTNEENYLFQKIARVLLRTNNVDNGSYISGRPLWDRLFERAGSAFWIHSLASLEKAEVIVILGSDPTQSVPVLSYFLKRATNKGIPLIVVDPRKIELARYSTLWLSIVPHTDLELINGLAALLLESDAFDTNFIEKFTEGFSLYRKGLKSLDFHRVCALTGLRKEELTQAATLLKGKKISFVIGHGLLQQSYGLKSMEALFNLLLMMGSLGHEKPGLYIPAWENNQIGAWDMGAVPDFLPGRLPLKNDTARHYWELAWQTKISPDSGINMVRMIEEIEKGNIKALYVMGENPLRSLPQPERVRAALSRLELLVVQDLFVHETGQIAHVILPGTPFAEKGGSFTNMEGRIQIIEPVVPPQGEAKPDWQILDLLSEKLGHSLPFGSVENIRKEITQLNPLYGNFREDMEINWIMESTPKRIFSFGGEGDLLSFTPVCSVNDNTRDERFPFTAILGSVRFHLGSGTRTSRSGCLREFALKGEVEISSEDSVVLNLSNGDLIRVSSPYGSITREVKIEKNLKTGLVFVPVAFNGNDAQRLLPLTLLGRDDYSSWKECQVTLEKA